MTIGTPHISILFLPRTPPLRPLRPAQLPGIAKRRRIKQPLRVPPLIHLIHALIQLRRRLFIRIITSTADDVASFIQSANVGSVSIPKDGEFGLGFLLYADNAAFVAGFGGFRAVAAVLGGVEVSYSCAWWWDGGPAGDGQGAREDEERGGR
jgi:hypothetical protein